MTFSCFRLLRLLSQRSLQTVVLLSLYFIFADKIPREGHAFFYTMSVFIKDLLVWLMPLTVVFFISHTVASFEKKAPLFIISLFLFEAFSNFLSVWYSYGAAHWVTHNLPMFKQSAMETSFSPLWRIPFIRPAWWSADKSCLVGLCLGCLSAWWPQKTLRTFLTRGKSWMEIILTRFFARLIPLFVLGFAANLYETDLLPQIVHQYGPLLGWLILVLFVYILLLFAIGAGFQPTLMIIHIKNLLPAGTIAFTSGCSLSTMPWTISGTAKNLENPEFAEAIIPATTNIQQIGDCIANTFLCFLLYTQFFGIYPGPIIWMTFSIAFVLARFATAAVIGGAIFVMLPIYEMYLNFTPEMIAVILAFNVMLDPLITSTNVMANGALCGIFEKVWRRVVGYLSEDR